MKLIIKLDDETYKDVMDRTEFDTLVLGIKLIEAVQNGTPLKFGNLSVEAIEELSHCPACIHYVQGDVPNVFCNSCKNRDELYRRIKNESNNWYRW